MMPKMPGKHDKKTSGHVWNVIKLPGTIVCVAALACSLGYAFYSGYLQQRDAASFNTLTSATHLKRAQDAWARGQRDEAFRHANAIPFSATESLEARRLIRSLAQDADRELKDRQDELRDLQVSEAKAQLENAKESLIRDLQSQLKNVGYDLSMSRSQKPDEVTITSKDFDDTGHRVRFLGAFRGRLGASSRLCSMGFSQIHLTTGGIFEKLKFNETYSLNCLR